jgi:hypothetical protein
MISVDFRRVEPKEIAGCRNLLGISENFRREHTGRPEISRRD